MPLCSQMMELLFLDGNRSQPPVLIPRIASSGLDPLGQALLDLKPPGRWRILPEPPADAASPVIRGWHRDAWVALPNSERASVAVASGRGVAALASMIEAAEVVVWVREPLEALFSLVGDAAHLPKRRVLAAVDQNVERVQMRIFANPQARALLLASSAPAELPVTLGPPADVDRWRRLLFEDVLPRVRPITDSGLPNAAEDLAERLGYDAVDRVRIAKGVKLPAVPDERPRVNETRLELLRELNWLDEELFAHARAGN